MATTLEEAMAMTPEEKALVVKRRLRMRRESPQTVAGPSTTE